MAKTKKKKTLAPRIENRKARHHYHIQDKLEVGIVLQGSEVKSIRNSQVSLGEGYARIEPRNMTLSLHDVHIAPYTHAGEKNGHEPIRIRRLLAHKREISRLFAQTNAKGVALVPLALYFVRGRVKLEIGVGTGKKQHDKRATDTDRDWKRQKERLKKR